jgi:cephalosporin hydroxylase
VIGRSARVPAPRLEPSSGAGLPPKVAVGRGDRVAQLWASRVTQSVRDAYAGVPISKMPEDLRVYEHLLWQSAPRVVIELGADYGGSALWFRDRLRTLETYGRTRDPFVVSVEYDTARATNALDAADASWRDSIHLLEGDIRDRRTADAVARLVPDGTPVLVVEDASHFYDSTFGGLTNFARFVQPGGFYVVEDGCVDVPELRVDERWPRGVLAALHDWLETDEGRDFRVRRDLELYGLTTNPEGFLQRLGQAAAGERP